MPLMLKGEWDALTQKVHDDLVAQFALRDLIIISNLVDDLGRTMRPEGAVRLLVAAGKPGLCPVKLMWTRFG